MYPCVVIKVQRITAVVCWSPPTHTHSSSALVVITMYINTLHFLQQMWKCFLTKVWMKSTTGSEMIGNTENTNPKIISANQTHLVREFRCFWGEKYRKVKWLAVAVNGTQDTGCATSALPLSCDNLTTSSPHNPLHVLHRWDWNTILIPILRMLKK